MDGAETYESFPVWVVLLSNLLAVSVYAVGAYILAGFGILFAALYLLYCLWIEVRVLRHSCVDCYYYGRLCGLGKGRLCSLLFRKGDPQRFTEREVSWRDLLPDFMVTVLPLIGGFQLASRGVACCPAHTRFRRERGGEGAVCVQVLQAEGYRVPGGKAVQRGEVRFKIIQRKV